MMQGMRAWAVPTWLVATALSGACGDDSSATGDPSSGTSSGGGSSSLSTTMPTEGSTQSGSTSSTSANPGDSSESGFEPTDPACGNGYVEADEQCDDGNDEDADDCNNLCQFQCGLQWSSVTLAPTGQSLLDPRDLTRDDDDNVYVVGFQREITTDQRGNETAEDDDVAVVKLDVTGAEQWSVRLAEDDADVDVAGIAVDSAGDVYVAATVTASGADDNIHVYKLSGATGEIDWSHVHDSAVDNAEDVASGIAVATDGNPVVSGRVRVAEGDNDAWVRKLDAADGDPVWTTTWTGTASGGFSTDEGGPIAIGPDGEVYVFAGEYVDFQTQRATLVRFAEMGGPAEQTYAPTVSDGLQDYRPLSVAVDADGSLAVVFVRILGAGSEFYLARIDGDGMTETWRFDQTTFADASPVEGGDDFVITAAEFGTDGELVATGVLERSGKGATWAETWIARLAPDGALGCMYVQEGPQQALLPGSLSVRAAGTASDGSALIAAQQVEDSGAALWVGSFRPE